MATELEATLPPFLRDCPTEPEDIPLQVQLLTMEVAQVRLTLTKLETLLREAALMLAPPAVQLNEAPDDGRGNDHH
jgi:hypothetical protein